MFGAVIIIRVAKQNGIVFTRTYIGLYRSTRIVTKVQSICVYEDGFVDEDDRCVGIFSPTK